MKNEKVIRYSLELAMLKQLFKRNLINNSEYAIIEEKLKKDYGIVSNITI